MKSSTIKNAIVFNALMIGYFLSPNLASFFGIALIASMIICPACVSKLADEMTGKDHSNHFDSLNYLYTRFLQKDLIMRIYTFLT